MATVIPKNAVRFTIDEIAAATNGRILRGGPPSVGMCTDSRAVDRRSAFVALIGEHFDGHAFLANAVAAGARALIVSRDIAVSQVGAPDVGPAVVRVADTRRALGDLARYHRLRWQRSASPSGKRSVIGITGSAGKTTTKTVLATILEAFFPGAVLATHGNLNNDVGVPMMLFGLAPEHWLGVFELGTNAKGEIARLSEIAVPDVAVLTLVAVAHTEGIGTIDDVAAEKGSLFAALTQEGLCVVNADDARAVAQLVRSPAKRRVSYGFSEKADVRILSRVALGIGGSQITLARPAGTLKAEVPLLGEAGALAVAAAVAVIEGLLGVQPEDQLRRALSALPAGGEGRLVPLLLDDGTWLIDDSYNANPASMRSSIATAAELAARERRRLLLVLGEMRELGALAKSEHTALGQAISATGAAELVGVGGHAEDMVAAASGIAAVFATNSDEALPLVLSRLRNGDVILVKGSRGVATEKIVRALITARGLASQQRGIA